MPARERLVLTFDAFGTLFLPREPIAKSYADTARQCGLYGFTDDQIARRFGDAYKRQSRNAPNYGREEGMAAPRWWSDIICETFSPFTSPQAFPKDLVPKLLHRFSSSQGYKLYPDVPPAFKRLYQLKEAARRNPSATDIITGIITNSDDRVPLILSSLGLSVGHLKYGRMEPVESGDQSSSGSGDILDIDFIALSYDVGYEKPSRNIFDAAKEIARRGRVGQYKERHIHIGDDIKKDVKGALDAQWEALLLDREGEVDNTDLGEKPIKSLSELESRIPGFAVER